MAGQGGLACMILVAGSGVDITERGSRAGRARLAAAAWDTAPTQNDSPRLLISVDLSHLCDSRSPGSVRGRPGRFGFARRDSRSPGSGLARPELAVLARLRPCPPGSDLARPAQALPARGWLCLPGSDLARPGLAVLARLRPWPCLAGALPARLCLEKYLGERRAEEKSRQGSRGRFACWRWPGQPRGRCTLFPCWLSISLGLEMGAIRRWLVSTQRGDPGGLLAAGGQAIAGRMRSLFPGRLSISLGREMCFTWHLLMCVQG
jgi:hypothetical protein